MVGAGGWFISQNPIANPFVQQQPDELNGSWRGEGVSEEYPWYVIYTFKNGTYTMKTESAFQDHDLKRSTEHDRRRRQDTRNTAQVQRVEAPLLPSR